MRSTALLLLTTQLLNQALVDRCLVRMQAFTSLAAQALQAELPGHDLLNAFSIFNCHGRSARLGGGGDLRGSAEAEAEADKLKSMERLVQVFGLQIEDLFNEHLDHEPIALHAAKSQNLSNFDAWKTAVLRTRSRRSTQQRHPSDSLLKVLIRYGAFTGATTSGVEQCFSRIDKHISSRKRGMSWEHELDEVKLILDHDSSQEGAICEAARRVWLLHFPAPRARGSAAVARIDKGCKRKIQNEEAPDQGCK